MSIRDPPPLYRRPGQTEMDVISDNGGFAQRVQCNIHWWIHRLKAWRVWCEIAPVPCSGQLHEFLRTPVPGLPD